MSEQTPRVSIGLPVYNGAAYVGAAIESLLAQTFTDFELIISDNASTDNTETICRSYANRDSRIRYYRQADNRGAIWNYNHVFELSRAMYFKWASHDDLCAPTFLERCVEQLDNNPEIVLCYTQGAKIDQFGQRMMEDPEDAFGPKGVVHTAEAGFPRQHHDSPKPHKRFLGVLLGSSWSADFFGVMRADVLRKTCMNPYCYGGEKVLSAEIALHGPVREIPDTLFLQRIHPNASGSRNAAEAQRQFVNPRRAKRFTSTRLRLLFGYVRAVQNTRLSLGERLGCFYGLLRYLLQIKKWKNVIRNAVAGAGVGNRKAKQVA
jgi:glycosyltransferase involved in cell wall biosynthesis